MSVPNSHHHEPRTVRRNFVCHCLEGGFYMGGMAFLSPDSVLGKMVDSLGGKVAVVAMMPVLMTAAFAFSQLFSAPIVERLPRLKPWVLTFGFLQRLPYLITGLLLLFGQSLGDKLLTIVVLTPVASGLIGGLAALRMLKAAFITMFSASIGGATSFANALIESGEALFGMILSSAAIPLAAWFLGTC